MCKYNTGPKMTQQYPGSPTIGITPSTGKANRVELPVAPVVGVYNNPQTIAPAVVIGISDKSTTAPNTVSTAKSKIVIEPVGAVTGLAVHTPLNSPIGVYPHFKTPTQEWTWDYGNS